MNKVDLWMPLYIGDYLSATSRLTTEQHGAYLLLIMDYWKNGPLPDDDATLAQITRLSLDAWSNACGTVLAYFKHDGKHYRHARIDAEIEAANGKKAKAVAKAKAAAGKRWEKDASGNATSNQQAMPKQCPSPSPVVSKDTHISKPDDLEGKSVRKGVWDAYAKAYANKYGAQPVRNTKTSSQVVAFVNRIGKEESALIAGWFVSHRDPYYVRNLHDFGLLLANAEKIRTEWATGRMASDLVGKTQHQLNQEATTRAIFGNPSEFSLTEKLISGEVIS